MSKGLLIALEGIDGSGTTSQAALVVETLRRRGLRVHLTAEPSRGPIGLEIRRVLRGELAMTSRVLAMLFAADRIDHLEREIEPELAQGAIVLSDRYLLSSLAYQSIDNPLTWVAKLNELARRPDLSLLLRVSSETAYRRRTQRGGIEERFDALETQRTIACAYDRVFTLADVGPAVVLDGEAEMTAVTAAILSQIDLLLARAADGATS